MDKPKAMQKTSEKAKEANKSREAQAATVAARKATRKTAKMEMMPLAGISCKGSNQAATTAQAALLPCGSNNSTGRYRQHNSTNSNQQPPEHRASNTQAAPRRSKGAEAALSAQDRAAAESMFKKVAEAYKAWHESFLTLGTSELSIKSLSTMPGSHGIFADKSGNSTQHGFRPSWFCL